MGGLMRAGLPVKYGNFRSARFSGMVFNVWKMAALQVKMQR